MPFLCRFGRHSPVRDRQLIDIADMRQETHCKRCGLAMEREAGTPWRVKIQPIKAERT
jgi:hypothetical protein